MKSYSFLFGMLAAAAMAHARGTVEFANIFSWNPTVGPPFFDASNRRLAGSNYLAQLYAGLNPDTLVAVGSPVPFLTGNDAGYFHGGVVSIPFAPWRGSVWVQVRAWEAAGGTSFETAALSGSWTGISSVLFVEPLGDPFGTPPFIPAPLYGLRYPGSPIVVRDPQDQRIRAGEQAQLSVVGSGGITLFYQWYQGQSGETNQPVPGATNATFTTPPLTTNSIFWVNLSTSVGATNSASANVTVHPANAAVLSMQTVARHPTLILDGVVDTRYRIQFSTNLNLTNWTDLLDFTLHTNPFEFVDPAATNSPSRVYRAIVP